MAIKYEIFSQELIELNKEMALHPDVVARMALQPDKDMYVRLADVAAFLNVALDGLYDGKDINKLADILTRKLQARRTIIVS